MNTTSDAVRVESLVNFDVVLLLVTTADWSLCEGWRLNSGV